MDGLKFGVVLSGLVGLVACFLPLGAGVDSFWSMRVHAPAEAQMTVVAYATGLVVPAIALVKPPILRWQALVSAMAFLFVLIKLRAVLGTFLVDGSIGAKLMVVAPILGLVFSILCLLKPATAFEREAG
jgi:hypothetical protein